MHFPIARYLSMYLLGFFVLVAILGAASIPGLFGDKEKLTGAVVVDEIPTAPEQISIAPLNATPASTAPSDR